MFARSPVSFAHSSMPCKSHGTPPSLPTHETSVAVRTAGNYNRFEEATLSSVDIPAAVLDIAACIPLDTDGRLGTSGHPPSRDSGTDNSVTSLNTEAWLFLLLFPPLPTSFAPVPLQITPPSALPALQDLSHLQPSFSRAPPQSLPRFP